MNNLFSLAEAGGYAVGANIHRELAQPVAEKAMTIGQMVDSRNSATSDKANLSRRTTRLGPFI